MRLTNARVTDLSPLEKPPLAFRVYHRIGEAATARVKGLPYSFLDRADESLCAMST